MPFGEQDVLSRPVKWYKKRYEPSVIPAGAEELHVELHMEVFVVLHWEEAP